MSDSQRPAKTDSLAHPPARPVIPTGLSPLGSLPRQEVKITAPPAPSNKQEISLPLAFDRDGDSPTMAHVRLDSRITREKLRQLGVVLTALAKQLQSWAVETASRPAGQPTIIIRSVADPANTLAIPFSEENGWMELAHIQFDGVLRSDMVGALAAALLAIEKSQGKPESEALRKAKVHNPDAGVRPIPAKRRPGST
jgi:hypothetical protein